MKSFENWWLQELCFALITLAQLFAVDAKNEAKQQGLSHRLFRT